MAAGLQRVTFLHVRCSPEGCPDGVVIFVKLEKSGLCSRGRLSWGLLVAAFDHPGYIMHCSAQNVDTGVIFSRPRPTGLQFLAPYVVAGYVLYRHGRLARTPRQKR